jgi:molybdopterin converting factor small subunit
MAQNVIAQVLGGEKKILDNVVTVKDVQSKLSVDGYTATVNGNTETADYQLEDGDFVSLAPAVKGGLI